MGYVREATPREVDWRWKVRLITRQSGLPRLRLTRGDFASRCRADGKPDAATDGILVREAGKTFSNAIAEVRERSIFSTTTPDRCGMISLTKPSSIRACGMYQPVELPAGDFTGQIAAALAAGNSVLAKPADKRR